MHDHPSHSDPKSHERRTLLAALLTGGFMLAEVAGGLIAGSLALLADAGHMLGDSASLALAWFAFRMARRGADMKRSYGYHRFQVLAAFVNGLTMFFIAFWIIVEAAGRLSSPGEILAKPMLIIAATGLLVNIVAFSLLHSGAKHNMNMRGALLHVMGDLLGSAAAITAALVILATGWMPIDPLLSVFVAGLIGWTAWPLVKQSGHILLEGTPEHVDPAEVRNALEAAIPDVADVHHVHIWSLTSNRAVLTLHAILKDGADQGTALAAIHTTLAEKFAISHATVQIEQGVCLDHAHPHPNESTVT